MPTLVLPPRLNDDCRAVRDAAIADDKSFPARVYDSASELPDESQLPGDTAVLLSEPVRWPFEVRCFVLDRQINALSPYFRGGELAITEEG